MKEEKTNYLINQEILEEKYYQLLSELKEFGLSDIELSEIREELSLRELEELLKQLKEEIENV